MSIRSLTLMDIEDLRCALTIVRGRCSGSRSSFQLTEIPFDPYTLVKVEIHGVHDTSPFRY